MNADLSPSDARLGALLAAVPAHGVQAMGAWCVADLQRAARALGQRFLHADLRAVQGKTQAMECLGQALALPGHFGRNLDALYDCLTDPEFAGKAPAGLVVVLEQIAPRCGFDRAQLLDCFGDAAEYWAEYRAEYRARHPTQSGAAGVVVLRCFYSFAS